MSAQAGEDPAVLLSARAARARGWRPVPLDHPHAWGPAKDKDGNPTGCTGAHTNVPCDGERGKHPCGAWGSQSATPPSDGMLQIWFGNDPRNIGIACGPSGLVVLDEDEVGALERLAGKLGHVLPHTYRVRTGRGWHYYFQAPTDRVVGNRAGALGPHHIDVRGGKGNGGYVVGAGSLHASGRTYVAEDESAPLAELPGWIIDLINTGTEGEPREGWTDDVRYGTREELIRQFERRVGEIRHRGGVFRDELFLAARDGWRLVQINELPELTMLGQLRDGVMRVWGAGPDARDRGIVYDQAKAAAEQSPWAVIAEPQELVPLPEYAAKVGDTGEWEVPDPVDQPTEYEKALQSQVRKERLRRDAHAILAAESLPKLRVLDFDEFLDSPIPIYLVPGMFYRDGLATVFGPPGSAKSFLMLDIALCVATGQPWRDRPMKRGRVHYVMAEGQAVNTLRTQAWLHFHDVDRVEAKGWFRTIPEGVVLTPAGIASYLPMVIEDQPDMIILDTKNLMYEGKESAGEDLGAMVRVLHKLRQAAGGCCVVLIDHTGLHDDTRVRGGNAQKGGMDTEIRIVEMEAGVREASITRDKSGIIGKTWHYTLRAVPEIPVPEDMAAPAVCVPAESMVVGSIRRAEDWNAPEQPRLPDDVLNYSGAGKAAILAVARFMRHSATGGVGMNLVQMRKAVKTVYVDDKGKPQWSDDTIERAWGALADLGRIEPEPQQGSTGRSQWVSRPQDPA